MSVNKYQPHIFILPEDDANRQLANGFVLTISSRQIHILTEARGWTRVCDDFAKDHIDSMRRYAKQLMILLIDFDGDPASRMREVRSAIPDDLVDRVFVLGARTEPEELRKVGLGSYERIGAAIANDCHANPRAIWDHDLLSHNAGELGRLRNAVRAWLPSP